MRKFFFSFVFFFLISPITYILISIANDTKRTDYPGKEIARLVENKWDKNFKNEIKIVIEDEWSAGNLSYHLSSRPKWMLTLKNKTSSIESNAGVIYTGNPKILKKNVTSPGGTTEAGLLVLESEKNGLYPLLKSTINNAIKRAKELNSDG